METNTYLVKDIRRFIAESAKNEFSPVLGPSVESDNKTNNDKAYKDAEKRAKDYDGGLANGKNNTKLPKKEDFNRTTLDYNPRVEPDKEWKDKVEAQAKGYTSTMEEKNGIEKAAQFDENGKILNQFKDENDEIQKERNALGTSGLQSSELEKKGVLEKKPTMTESTTLTPKRLIFKHRRFMNESQMLQLIPEEYKRDGQTIYMKDAHNNEYIVECVASKTSGLVETQVKGFENKELVNEQMNRMQQLMNYDAKTTSGRNIKNTQLNESQEFRNVMNILK